MSPEVTSGLFALAGGLIGGLIAWWIQSGRITADLAIQGSRIAADLAIAVEAVKTEHMAEKTARYYLNHKGYKDRSFDYLSKRLGGFTDDELRKILVRAGAVRYIRENGTEWWRLLSRVAEATNKPEPESLGPGNDDL